MAVALRSPARIGLGIRLAALVVVGGLLYGCGWLAAAVVRAGAWCVSAVALGWSDGRRP